uniref:PpiC-type peptidyl-prolyl cis-trans isomerase n=1 Tax=Solibacter usitatus (strain Ellin6076) TaxID=234267 RepID=Q029S0_SOLUE
MRFPSVVFLAALSVSAIGVPVMAQEAPKAQPPVMTRPDGATVPLEVTPPPAPLPPNRVILQVGEIALTAGQLEQILEAYSEAQRVYVNGPGRPQFIQQLIRVLMLSQEGKRRKLDETDRYRNQLTYSAAGILSNHTEEDIRKKIKIDDAMLEDYLKAHPLDYMQVRARHILIRTPGSSLPLEPGQKELTDAEALTKAQELRAKIVAGADFADVAKIESNDISTNTKGGDLGFFKRGQMAPSIEEAAFALKPGEISQPVKTSMGYTVIKVEEIKPVKSFEELRPDLERNLRNELTRKYVDDLKALTKIEIDPEFAAPRKGSFPVKPAQ